MRYRRVIGVLWNYKVEIRKIGRQKVVLVGANCNHPKEHECLIDNKLDRENKLYI